MMLLLRILAVLSVALCTTHANGGVYAARPSCSRQTGLAFAGGFIPRPLLPARSCGQFAEKWSGAPTSRVLVPHTRKSCAVGTCMVGSMGGSMGDSRSWGSDPLGEGDQFGGDDAWEGLGKVFVLLFNPRTDQEGIYTLQIKRRDGQLVNTIVMFEETEDAERYSGLLEAQDFPPPSVEVIEPAEIKEFATDAGYQTTFIPKGTLFMPPEANVNAPNGDWHLDEPGQSGGGGRIGGGGGLSEEHNAELDEVRMQLERLYGGGKA